MSVIRRAWVWAFGAGRFGGALLWTLFGIALLLATPALLLLFGAAWLCTLREAP